MTIRESDDSSRPGLILVNPDDFNVINQRFGRDVGDAAIREIGERLRATARRTDFAFRYGAAVFGLLLVYSVFAFYFIFVLGTLIVGIGTMIWIRWYRFPPLIMVYNSVLRREQYLAQKKYATAESTIRTKSKGRSNKSKSKGKKRKR